VLASVDVSFAALDQNGVVVEVSDSWIHFAQEDVETCGPITVGVNYLEVCRRAASSDSNAQRVFDGILAVMNGAALRFTHEFQCNMADNSQHWFTMTVAPHPNIRGGAIIVNRNDSQIKSTERFYNALLDSVRAIVWRAEPFTFRVTFVSKQIEEILGFPADNWTNDPEFWVKHLHPEDRDWVLQYSSNEVAARRNHSFAYRIFDAHGRTLWLRDIVNVVVENGNVKELDGVSVDVTVRKQAEVDRDLLAVRLLRSQEEERSAIARELHDDIGQSMALMDYKLMNLKNSLDPGSDQARLAEEAIAFKSQIATDVHRISHGLHSSLLELLGLTSAVAQHCREYAETSPAQVDVDVAVIPRNLSKDVTTSIYRVLQECLRNITKHSKAEHVTVRLSLESNQIQLQVCDNGIGFDPQNEQVRQGLGLFSMMERIRLVNGKLTVTASPGSGTQVTATVPIH
jgi:PAS domain S-box-containing protein